MWSSFPFGFESGMWDLIILFPIIAFLFTLLYGQRAIRESVNTRTVALSQVITGLFPGPTICINKFV